MQLYQWDILKSNFIVSTLLSMESFQLNLSRKTETVFWITAIVLRSSQISPEGLLLTLNSINPSIQFTIEYSKGQIPFLDILIKRNENGTWMDLYHKPKDTQRCLSFTSIHPKHCKWNIPFCLAQRICTIAGKLKNLENLKWDLSKYHYPDSLKKQEFQKAISIPQKDLQKPRKLSNENILLFITFNPNHLHIHSTTKPSVNCLKNNNVSGFHNIKLTWGKHQSPNLQKILTKVEFGEVLSGRFNF